MDIRRLGPDEKIFDLYHWSEVLQESGDGGKVVVCQSKGNQERGGRELVLKMRSKESLQNNRMEEQFRNAQVRLLNMPAHPGIVTVHEVLEDSKFYYMLMEKGTSFFDGLMSQYTDGIMPPGAVKRLVRDILEAVEHVHQQGMLHRDIKPDNIVLDACGHLRIVDFGGCRALWRGEGWCETSGCAWGAPPYVAPEVHRRELYGKESDFWSVGVILYEMIFGGPPFVDDKRVPATTAARVVHWKEHLVIPFYPGVGEDEVDLVRRLVCDAPDRLTASGVRAHCSFAGLEFARLREMDPPIRPSEKVRRVSGFDRYDSDTEPVFSSLATWSSFGGPQASAPATPRNRWNCGAPQASKALPISTEPPFAAVGPAPESAALCSKGRARWTLLSAIGGICSR